jgi:hypothetical protein
MISIPYYTHHEYNMNILQPSSPSEVLYRRVSRVIPPFEWPFFEAKFRD